MPVFLFGLSQADSINWGTAILGFAIMHFFIFPSSNGYNSFQDRDDTSIGGLKHPPKVSRNLLYVTILFDVVGIVSGLFISFYFSLLVLVFVLMSHAYSYRGLRLKKYPVVGFLTVFIFQGGYVYLIALTATNNLPLTDFFTTKNIICMIAASLFMGSVYPLTQIYQHEADKRDGVISLSYKLGYAGTFIFSGVLFSMATILLLFYFNLKHQVVALILFLLINVPVVLYLSRWFGRVRQNTSNANFENTMTMNKLTSTCMNLYFTVLILNHYWFWF
jgi:1,4-dihydroxy-2-naphthoate octaprenyltransferase